jgi:hypothetical protein
MTSGHNSPMLLQMSDNGDEASFHLACFGHPFGLCLATRVSIGIGAKSPPRGEPSPCRVSFPSWRKNAFGSTGIGFDPTQYLSIHMCSHHRHRTPGSSPSRRTARVTPLQLRSFLKGDATAISLAAPEASLTTAAAGAPPHPLPTLHFSASSPPLHPLLFIAFHLPPLLGFVGQWRWRWPPRLRLVLQASIDSAPLGTYTPPLHPILLPLPFC